MRSCFSLATTLSLRILLGAGLLTTGCDDELPGPLDLGPPLEDLGEGEDVPTPELPEAPDIKTEPSNHCESTWTYVMPESGIASHPVTASDGRTLIAAGDTLRRISATGTSADDCSPPFKAAGEVLGTPTMTTTGIAFVGSASGKLYAVSRQCKAKWTAPVNLRAKACEKTGSASFCTLTSQAVREAPALLTDTAIFILDDTPALYRVDDLGAQPDYRWPFLTSDPDPMPGAAPVIAGGQEDTAFVAFPTRRTVVAVNTNGSRRWEFDELLGAPGGPPERYVTSPLAVTKEGDIVFAAGKPDGDAFSDLALYRLLSTSPDKQARIAPGFPRALGLASDAVRGIAIAPDESVVLAMAGNGIIKLDQEGNQLWKFIGDEESLRATSVPALGDDGSIFVTAEPRFVYGIDKDGLRIFRYESPGGGVLDTTSPTIREDGVVLVHFGSELKAYTCDATRGLAVSSWPRYQRNNRSSGRLEEPN
jgi:outer membrane protein assembly factor BamB